MKTALTFFLLITSTFLNAQQSALSASFWNNYSHVNPATTALEYKMTGSLMYRNQWVGFNGAPKAVLVNFNTRLGDNHGVGANFENLKIGFSQINTLSLNYNYKVKFGVDKSLSIGIAPILKTTKLLTELIPPTITPDPVLSTGRTTELNLNFGMAYAAEHLMLGIGVTQLTDGLFINIKDSIFIHPSREFSVIGHYKLMLGKKVELKPQFIFRSDFIFSTFDINLLATLKDKYWIGASYRKGDALIAMLGWDVKGKYRIGYSYERVISKLSVVTNASHEINLGFILK